jgi:hypothetical protein
VNYHVKKVSMGVNGVILLVFRQWIPMIFTNDAEVIKISADAFFVVIGFQCIFIRSNFKVFDGFQGVSGGVLRGIGAQKLGALFMFISYYIFGIPIALIFAFVFDLKVVGLWGGLTVGLFMVTILFFIKIAFFINWEKEVKLAKERVEEEIENDEPKNQDDYSNELNESQITEENQENIDELENYKINFENKDLQEANQVEFELKNELETKNKEH